MIATSYFASKLWRDKKAVAISQGIPKWFKGRSYKALAPSWNLVRVKDEDEYTRRYRQEALDRLSPQKVLDDLGKDAVLLCWEKPGDFCHRRLVAEWLEKAIGITVPELGLEATADTTEQLSLI